MPIFEDYFKKHNIQKWQQAKDAKPNIKPGMTDDMSALYDDIAQNKAQNLKSFKMLDILENIVEGLIEEEKATEGMSELGFYRPVTMIIEVLFRKSQFGLKDGETCSNASTKTCRQLNEELCDDQDTISTTIGRRIDLSMRVKAILITLFAMEKSQRTIATYCFILSMC
ncbi:hypothetical protein V8B55DRAFT_1416800 [Mucor lusitanicus]|uniref:Uncharacterized protein n=1 Tax=Mucor lusitanicus CBS 277.49 TaxID=747725 RepID=A0A162ZM82_MUCCL|nr:hypothetical protein MUCCIDRAFT_78381 [Mucor lusitanicus CBS 277.49]